ncbi:MAG: bifunctional phosphoribosylaminoimidazolecarboxamide formyltransferase/IMP cyclohydrolase [Vicinamibacterales bacterium]
MKRALLSVSDKSGLVDLARALASRGFSLISTGGTARMVADAGIPVTPVSDVTGMPEMMDGRIKTLHPRIHGGILARRDHPGDLEAAGRHGIGLIDLVVVNLYPFARAAADPDVRVEALIEEIDIGGPSMVRAAAKNFSDVLVVVDPSDYPSILEQLDRPGGPTLDFRLGLARKAFAHTADYDRTIARTLFTLEADAGALVRRAVPPGLPGLMTVDLEKLRDLRYGENPHQPAAWYRWQAGGSADIEVLQGKELSYTNLLDLDAAVRIVAEFDSPAAVVIKHTNPCGAATASSPVEAYVRAREADPLSAFGGIVGLNRPVDEETAAEVASTFIEAIVAPGISEKAREKLAVKKNLRVVVAPALSAGSGTGAALDLRGIFCGVLAQRRDRVTEGMDWGATSQPAGVRVVTRRQPTGDEWRALSFAWRLVAHVKSNAVIFTDAERTLAIGAGQMSRVDAVNVALMKARSKQRTAEGSGPLLPGSVAASDAFFPFRDGLDAVAAAGATAVVQPGGSVRDQEVIAAADEHGIAMVFTGVRHFRH